MADYCPEVTCGRVATEIVDGIAYCAIDAGRKRRKLAGKPELKRPDPLALHPDRFASEIQVLIEGRPAMLRFNEFNEPTELQIGVRRWALYPR